MSGHSKWSTIKRAKGATDAKRGLTFTKLANAVTIAARAGGSGDPDTNPRLRYAVDAARSVNMPKDNIQRAIDRGMGNLPGQSLEEVLYEGFAPGGKVSFILEGVTDNRMRTNAEIKNLIDRGGGSLGAPGSVAYMFNRLGEVKAVSKGGSADDEMLELIDVGAEDVEEVEEEGIKKYFIYTQVSELNTMSAKITQLGYTVEAAEVIYKPTMSISIEDPEQVEKVVGFLEKLEDHDDVQKVYANLQ